jgi:hypothetical protein
MRPTTRAGVATLALLCSVSIGGIAAVAQTGGMPTGTSPGGGAAPPTVVTPQGQINPTTDQGQALVQSLQDLATQIFPGFFPSLGASVPQDMQLKPIPPQAKEAMPPQIKQALPQPQQGQDHHVAKTDDNTIVIVDPVTRQVVGVITVNGDGSLALGGPAPSQGTQPGQPQYAPQPGAPGTK